MRGMVNPQAHPNSAIVFASQGAIGQALAARLLDGGDYAAVYGTTRSRDTVAIPGLRPLHADLTDEASVAAAFASVDPAPSLVIVASGLLHDADRGIAPEKSIKALDPAALRALFEANTVGPALVAKHAIGRLPRDRRAVFVVLSARVGSIADNRLGGWHAYRASKAALNMLVKTLAIELARSHPLAIAAALHPGTVDSRLSAPFQRGVPAGKLFSPDQAAGHLLDVLTTLTPDDSGGLFAWDGTRLPY